MKKFSQLLIAVLAIAMCACSDDDKPISSTDLPADARSFVEKYYPSLTIIYAEKDSKHSSTTYDILLSDGTEVEFDSDGRWLDINAPYGKAVPAALVPQPIADFVALTFPDQLINEFSRESYGFKAELTNDIGLEFSHDYIFLHRAR